MYSLSTLKDLNDNVSLKRYIDEHPPAKIYKAGDVTHAPDYAQVDLDLLEKVSKLSLVKEYFVDSSGVGGETESAITYPRFEKKIQNLLEEGKDLYAVLSGIGQFQVHVSILEKK